LAKGERDIEVDGARKKGMEMSEHDELAKRVSELERDLAEAKKALEALKPKEPFVPRVSVPKIDYTEGMSMSGPALKPMVDLINPPKVKLDADGVRDAWARSRISGPSGFGPGDDSKWQKRAAKVREEEKLEIPKQPWSGWRDK